MNNLSKWVLGCLLVMVFGGVLYRGLVEPKRPDKVDGFQPTVTGVMESNGDEVVQQMDSPEIVSCDFRALKGTRKQCFNYITEITQIEGQFPLIGTLTAYHLFNAYQANEVAADEKYQRKAFRISGIVDSIQITDNGTVMLSLFGDPMRQNFAVAYLSDLQISKQPEGDLFPIITDRQSVLKLRRGSSVTMDCLGSGFHMGSPTMVECRFYSAADSAS